MASAGQALLAIAFVASLAAIVFLLAGHVSKKHLFQTIGRASVLGNAVALLACCLLLVFCFMSGDVSIQYVLEERSLSTDSLAWLYKLAGLWAGRSGSLLFWTFLMSLFNTIILARSFVDGRAAASKLEGDAMTMRQLDNLAMAVVAIVVGVFCGVLMFSSNNMPFIPTPDSFFNPDGTLTAAASVYSMNQLLEHWAMAIHPPLLFVGYAGLAVPFAYAMATLIVKDDSALWVKRSTRFVLASWLFLGAGIGLGAAWAYVVLGWGGYWGWDPVENASLLPWLICVALAHSFTVYQQRGAFKKWAVMCACLAFTFVIIATFVTRSGIVQSVHAFVGDPVSLALFGGLIVVSVVVPIIAIVARRKMFAADAEGADDVENFLSKNAAYYFNNVIMLLFTLLLTYMTVCSALPSWLPFGGSSLSATAYEAVARPLGIAYLFILAVCPLLAWGKTDPKKFLRQARIPAVCAIVLFAVLAWWWATRFVPIYNATMAKGGALAQTLLEAGPGWYYNGLALVGLLVASLLFFNALFLFVRNVRVPGKRAASIGGSFAHIAMGVILVGLIGSSMYVYEQSGYMATQQQQTATEVTDIVSAEPFDVGAYRLEYVDGTITDNREADNTILYAVTFDVSKNGQPVGQVTPSVQLNVMTQQQKLNAGVMNFPEEDLFVVFRGITQNDELSLDVRINPFIMLVWIGFGMLMAGTLFALVGPRRTKHAKNGDGSAAMVEGGNAPSQDPESASLPSREAAETKTANSPAQEVSAVAEAADPPAAAADAPVEPAGPTATAADAPVEPADPPATAADAPAEPADPPATAADILSEGEV